MTETVEREDESEGYEPKFSLHSAGGIDGSLLRIVSADKYKNALSNETFVKMENISSRRERRSRGGSR